LYPNKCGLCDNIKSKKYHLLYYRVNDGEILDMKICDKCMTILEASSEATKKYIESEKNESLGNSKDL
jgi:hypothetical protein